jgi:cysteine desulfurase family protein (TIGR01976 family)
VIELNKPNIAHSFPIQQIRNQFPALQRTYHQKQAVYLDGPGGSQVVQSAIDAMVAYMSNGGANLHGMFPSSIETEQMIADSREAVADFVNAEPSEVAFGANMTTLALSIARALGRDWNAEDEIVVTEMDHRANVDPWLTMAQDKGVTVRWIPVNETTLTLNLEDLDSIITSKTKLVAVGLASNAVGTISDVARIAQRAKEVGAIVTVDAVHAAPHIAISREELQADILLCSAYKFFGPHVGIAVIHKELFEQLEAYKLVPAPNYLPDKLETGTQNHEGIAGIKATIDFIASLGEGSTRKERLRVAFDRIEEYEETLTLMMKGALEQNPKVTLFQAGNTVKKTPTIAFQIEGVEPEEFCKRLAEEHSIFIASGDFYASTLAKKSGIDKTGGWIRAGIAPYNTTEEIERFIEALNQISM